MNTTAKFLKKFPLWTSKKGGGREGLAGFLAGWLAGWLLSDYGLTYAYVTPNLTKDRAGSVDSHPSIYLEKKEGKTRNEIIFSET